MSYDGSPIKSQVLLGGKGAWRKAKLEGFSASDEKNGKLHEVPLEEGGRGTSSGSGLRSLESRLERTCSESMLFPFHWTPELCG
jgi:hypothetical protein